MTLEDICAQLLDARGVTYEREFSPIDLLGVTGRRLRFDFFIEQKKLLIEADGLHHLHPSTYKKRNVIFPYNLNSGWSKSSGNLYGRNSTDYRRQREHDTRKCAWSVEHGMRLLRMTAQYEQYFIPVFDRALADDNWPPLSGPRMLPGGKMLQRDSLGKYWIVQGSYLNKENWIDYADPWKPQRQIRKHGKVTSSPA